MTGRFPRMFWHEPATGRRRLTLDHGADVIESPAYFGIDDATADLMDDAFGDADRDDPVQEVSSLPAELDPAVAWGLDDAWEQLAFQRGWVRVAPNGRGVSMSAATVPLAKATLAWIVADDARVDVAEIEVCDAPGTTIRYAEIGRDDIHRFVSEDDATASRILDRVGRMVDRAKTDATPAAP